MFKRTQLQCEGILVCIDVDMLEEMTIEDVIYISITRSRTKYDEFDESDKFDNSESRSNRVFLVDDRSYKCTYVSMHNTRPENSFTKMLYHKCTQAYNPEKRRPTSYHNYDIVNRGKAFEKFGAEVLDVLETMMPGAIPEVLKWALESLGYNKVEHKKIASQEDIDGFMKLYKAKPSEHS